MQFNLQNGVVDKASKLNAFPRSRRVLDAAAFTRVFKNAQRKSFGRWSVFQCNVGLPYARMGVIVGKRAVKRAVHRNQLKRWVREQFRLSSSTLTPYDYVIRLRTERRIEAAEFPRLKADLHRLFAALASQPKEQPPSPEYA